MTRERGTTVIELLVATAIMLAASAAALTLVVDATAQSPRWNDVADLHQRTRVAIDAIVRQVTLAAAAPPVTALRVPFPAIEPRRRSSFLLSNAAITIRHVPEGAAWTTITSELTPASATVAIDVGPGCPAGVEACGFVDGASAAVADGAGDWHLLTVSPIAPALLGTADRVGGRTATFAAGSTLVEVLETSLYFDPETRTLRQEGPGDGSFPVVDHVSELSFQYFSEPLAPLALGTLMDGPLCGSGALAYDCDLRRIRTVRASLRLEASVEGGRDIRVTVDITPRRAPR